MEEVCILIQYLGSWETQSNGEMLYVGGEVKGLSIPINTRFSELIDLLHSSLGIDSQMFQISLSAKFKVIDSPSVKMMRVENDSDVKFFLNYSRTYRLYTQNLFSPLFVTTVEKIKRKMEEVCILIQYLGSWETQSNGEMLYVGGEVKGLSISINTRFSELIDLLHSSLGIDPQMFQISLSAKFGVIDSQSVKMMQVENDSDVKFFLNYSRAYRPYTQILFSPLFVTTVEKINQVGPTEPIVGRTKLSREQIIRTSQHFRSSSSSNQISQTTPSFTSHDKDDVHDVPDVAVNIEKPYVPELCIPVNENVPFVDHVEEPYVPSNENVLFCDNDDRPEHTSPLIHEHYNSGDPLFVNAKRFGSRLGVVAGKNYYRGCQQHQMQRQE